jgi:hypothetical protein
MVWGVARKVIRVCQHTAMYYIREPRCGVQLQNRACAFPNPWGGHCIYNSAGLFQTFAVLAARVAFSSKHVSGRGSREGGDVVMHTDKQ